MIIYYYGTGKGKTTAGLGALIRAKLNDKKILLIQFLKNNTVESKSLNGFCFGDSSFISGTPEKKHFGMAKDAFDFFMQKKKDYDVIMLDELGIALYYKLLEKKIVLDTISEFQGAGYPVLIVTGRPKIPELEKIADLVSEIKEQKHPYNEGKSALKGIDY